MFIAAFFPNWGVINIVLHGYEDWDFVSPILRKEWKCLVQRIATCCKVKTSLVHCTKVWTCVTGCIEKPNVQRVLFQVLGYLAQLSLRSVCLRVCASCILPSFVYPLVAKPLLVVNNYSIKLSWQTLTDISGCRIYCLQNLCFLLGRTYKMKEFVPYFEEEILGYPSSLGP